MADTEAQSSAAGEDDSHISTSAKNVVATATGSGSVSSTVVHGAGDTAPPRQQQQRTTDRNDDSSSGDFELKYGAGHVINLFVPVSLCMAMVVITMNTINFYTQSGGRHLIYTPFVKETDSISEKALMSIGNALVMLIVVVIMTTLLIIFYKYRFYRLIHGWLILSSFLLLFFFTTLYIHEVLKTYSLPLSSVTVCFLLMNFGVLGMMCIHWKGPLKLQQFYLITISALMALVFIKYLPEWTVWAVLAVISIWDLVAVLAPKGPLRILVETAQERNEPIFPALIYSSAMLYPYVLLGTVSEGATEPMNDAGAGQSGSGNSQDPLTAAASNSSSESTPSTTVLLQTSSSSNSKRPKVKRIAVPPTSPDSRAREAARALNYVEISNQDQSNAQHQVRRRVVEEEKGVKLGLGDFIFYSVLVGKASSYFDWNTTVACYVAILVGLCFTLMLLAMFKRALPALPISIFAGLSFYFCTRWIITPFVSVLTQRQVLY